MVITCNGCHYAAEVETPWLECPRCRSRLYSVSSAGRGRPVSDVPAVGSSGSGWAVASAVLLALLVTVGGAALWFLLQTDMSGKRPASVAPTLPVGARPAAPPVLSEGSGSRADSHKEAGSQSGDVHESGRALHCDRDEMDGVVGADTNGVRASSDDSGVLKAEGKRPKFPTGSKTGNTKYQ